MEKIKNSSLYGEIKNKYKQLEGNGQAQCNKCKNISWCCFLYKDIENNKIYCEKCLNEVLNK